MWSLGFDSRWACYRRRFRLPRLSSGCSTCIVVVFKMTLLSLYINNICMCANSLLWWVIFRGKNWLWQVTRQFIQHVLFRWIGNYASVDEPGSSDGSPCACSNQNVHSLIEWETRASAQGISNAELRHEQVERSTRPTVILYTLYTYQKTNFLSSNSHRTSTHVRHISRVYPRISVYYGWLRMSLTD